MLPQVSGSGKVIPQNDVDAIICKWLFKLLSGEETIDNVLAYTKKELESVIP